MSQPNTLGAHRRVTGSIMFSCTLKQLQTFDLTQGMIGCTFRAADSNAISTQPFASNEMQTMVQYPAGHSQLDAPPQLGNR